LMSIGRYDSVECSVLGSDGRDVIGLPHGVLGYRSLIVGLFVSGLFLIEFDRARAQGWVLLVGVLATAMSFGFLLVGVLSGNCPTGNTVVEVEVFGAAVGIILLVSAFFRTLPKKTGSDADPTLIYRFFQVWHTDVINDVFRWLFIVAVGVLIWNDTDGADFHDNLSDSAKTNCGHGPHSEFGFLTNDGKHLSEFIKGWTATGLGISTMVTLIDVGIVVVSTISRTRDRALAATTDESGSLSRTERFRFFHHCATAFGFVADILAVGIVVILIYSNAKANCSYLDHGQPSVVFLYVTLVLYTVVPMLKVFATPHGFDYDAAGKAIKYDTTGKRILKSTTV
jgi:hypothetical protein